MEISAKHSWDRNILLSDCYAATFCLCYYRKGWKASVVAARIKRRKITG